MGLPPKTKTTVDLRLSDEAKRAAALQAAAISVAGMGPNATVEVQDRAEQFLAWINGEGSDDD